MAKRAKSDPDEGSVQTHCLTCGQRLPDEHLIVLGSTEADWQTFLDSVVRDGEGEPAPMVEKRDGPGNESFVLRCGKPLYVLNPSLFLKALDARYLLPAPHQTNVWSAHPVPQFA
jgi:hypothetical protein